mgnify:CR=1 FL=1
MILYILIFVNRMYDNIYVDLVVQHIYDQYIQCWFHTILNATKLDTYCLFKTNFVFEPYIDLIDNRLHRIAFTRIRLSSHRLAIEEGRFRNIERNNRICRCCTMNVIENEYHFVLVCPFYRSIRSELLPRYFCSWPTIYKFKTLFQSRQAGLIKKLATFVYLSYLKRSGKNSIVR